MPEFTLRGLRAGVEWGRIAWGGGLDLRAVLEHLGWSFEELPSGAVRLLDGWADDPGGRAPELLEAPAGAEGWFPVAARQRSLDDAASWPDLDAAIRCELEPSAVELLARLHAEGSSFAALGAATDTDQYLLEQVARCSPSWPQLREQALRMRTSGPLLRALFASERAAFSQG